MLSAYPLNDCLAEKTKSQEFLVLLFVCFPQGIGIIPFVCLLCFYKYSRVNSSSLVGVCLLKLHAFFLSESKQLIFVSQNSTQYRECRLVQRKPPALLGKIKTLLKNEPFVYPQTRVNTVLENPLLAVSGLALWPAQRALPLAIKCCSGLISKAALQRD